MKKAIVIGLGFALLTGVFVYVNAVRDGRPSQLPERDPTVMEDSSALTPGRESAGSSAVSDAAGTVQAPESSALQYAAPNGEALRTMSLSEANPNADPGMTNALPGSSADSASPGQTSSPLTLRESIVIAETPVAEPEIERQSRYSGSLPGDGRSGDEGPLPGADDSANLVTGPLPGEGEDGVYGPLPGEGEGSSFVGPLPGEGEPDIEGSLPGTENPG